MQNIIIIMDGEAITPDCTQRLNPDYGRIIVKWCQQYKIFKNQHTAHLYQKSRLITMAWKIIDIDEEMLTLIPVYYSSLHKKFIEESPDEIYAEIA